MESILGLELTENRLKLLELKGTEKGLQVARLNKIDLPPNSTKEGVIVEPRLVAAKINAFLTTILNIKIL